MFSIDRKNRFFSSCASLEVPKYREDMLINELTMNLLKDHQFISFTYRFSSVLSSVSNGIVLQLNSGRMYSSTWSIVSSLET